jgi:YidC/Oxa1 family membrane protein insertase
MQQKRLILALVLSSTILFAWSYFYPVKTPQNNGQASASPSPTASTENPGNSSSPNQPTQTAPAAAAQTSAPQRTITIQTPLYTAKFDTRGAEPVSWILTWNKHSKGPIYSVGGKRSDQMPLELISEEGLKRQPRLVPLQVRTGDQNLDDTLAGSTYRIEELGKDSMGDSNISLKEGEKKQLTFAFEDQNGLQVRKAITFNANSYATDLAVSIQRGGQPVPQLKLTVGPSIGDQGLKHYTFYSVAPEAISFVNGGIERHLAASINGNKNSPDRLTLGGPIDWAGVADTYFGMAAIPLKQTEGLDYHTVAYEMTPPGSKPEKHYLVTALVPLPSDGHTLVYTGPKDHYLLNEANEEVSKTAQRQIDLEGLIDYGYLKTISRPLAVPILQAITYLSKLTGSYGVAIILFTIVIYSLFFPLKWRSSKSMKKAQKLAPRMKELQEKIKNVKQNDPRLKELQMEQLRLMKEGNPLGGCLPLLIQMPFLFALYRAITISLDFRQASFLWIPDLSAAEPYLIHILPILMTGTMVVLQLVTPAPSADPLQRKMMAIGMPMFMLYVLWSAPSGLVLYWLVGNIVGFTQQFLINRWTATDEDASPPTTGKSNAGGGKKSPPSASQLEARA